MILSKAAHYIGVAISEHLLQRSLQLLYFLIVLSVAAALELQRCLRQKTLDQLSLRCFHFLIFCLFLHATPYFLSPLNITK